MRASHQPKIKKSFSGYSRERNYTAKEKKQFQKQTQENLKNFYQTQAQRTIQLLDTGKRAGTPPALTLPYNPATKTVFTGINSFILSQYMLENGHTDARFCKGFQVKRLNEEAHILKGEKGIRILEPRKIRIKNEMPEDQATEEEFQMNGEEDIFSGMNDGEVIVFRPVAIFHVSQLKNIPPLENKHHIDWKNEDIVERLVESCGVKIRHGSQEPNYTIGNDTIHMPAKRSFESPEHYKAALLKQWYVATGAMNREGRINGPSRIGQGLLNQGAEALRQETFAMVAGQTLGLPYDPTAKPIDKKCWEKQLKENPRHIVAQTAHATRMVNTVVEFSQGLQPEADWFPEKETWPELSELDEQLNAPDPGNPIADQIHEIFARNSDFSLNQGDGIIEYISKETGDAGIITAIQIREELINRFEDLEVNITQHDGRVIMSMEPEIDQNPDMGPTQSL